MIFSENYIANFTNVSLINVISDNIDIEIIHNNINTINCLLQGNTNIENYKPKLNINIKTNILYISISKSHNINWGLFLYGAKLIIKVPIKYNANLIARTINSNISIYGGTYKNLTIISKSGDICLKNIFANNTEISDKNGNILINFKNSNSYKAIFSSKSGTITMPNKFKYNNPNGQSINCNTKNGDIKAL